ncbi:Kinesin-like protein KIF18A [Nymphon striatum]|nr:Kinesin-like protein KIF18A [Nymphon striatum]
MVLSIHSSVKKNFKRLSGSPRKRPGRSSIGSSSSDLRDTKSNVKVIVRVRPQNEREEQAGQEPVIKVIDENILVFDPKEEQNDFYFRGKRQKGRDLLKKPKKDLKLAFDRVFDGNSTNEEVFKETTHSIVDGLLNGYNCSVFAYGATGAGKTFTMLGSADTPGITFLTVMELYKRIDSMNDKSCDIAVSYLEVYNETIHDLLMPSQPLALREDPQRGVVVSGLTLHKPKHAQDLLSMLQFGNKNRTQHPTDANAESSRSHAVFIVYVKQQDRAAGLKANVRVAKMVLIDLAGSERATVTRNSGARMREGANINKSLLALGNCINSLADKKSKSQHVPYRDSKLTRLLKDSLGGNCQTVMIAAVSPSTLTYEDTYNTLRYADRAKNIKANLRKNVVSVDMHVTKYAKMIDELKRENSELKNKLSCQPEAVAPEPCSCSSGEKAIDTVPGTISTPKSVELQNQIQKEMQRELQSREKAGVELLPTFVTEKALHDDDDIFSDRRSILNELLNFEMMDRHLDVRLSWRQTNIDRLTMISINNLKVEKSTQKADHAIKLMKRKRNRIHTKKPELVKQLSENMKLVEMTGQEVDSIDVVTVKSEFKQHQMEIEMLTEKKKVQHLQQVVRMQDVEITRSETIMENALKLVRQQQLILSGHGYLTSDLKDDFEDLHKQVEGCKEVAWADQEGKRMQKDNQLDIDKLIDLEINTISSTHQNHTVVSDNSCSSQLPPKSLSNSDTALTEISPDIDENHSNVPKVPTVLPFSKDLPNLETGTTISKENTIVQKKAMKRSLSIESPILSAASQELLQGIKKKSGIKLTVDSPILSAASQELIQDIHKPVSQTCVDISEKSTVSTSNDSSEDAFVNEIQRSPKKDSLINKKALKRSLSIESPLLSAASKEIILGIKQLGLDSAHKFDSAPSETMALTANILFEPPIINSKVKKCLNKQFSDLKPAHNLNETFEPEQSCSSVSPLNQTFEKLPESDLKTENASSCVSVDKKPSTNLNVTFSSDVKTPSRKILGDTTFTFKTPSRTPLSNTQNLSKSTLKSLSRSTEFKAKKPGKKLCRTQSISALKPENRENRGMKRFSSSRLLPAAMTKTAILRTIMSRNKSVSSLTSDSTLKNLVNEKKGSTASR